MPKRLKYKVEFKKNQEVFHKNNYAVFHIINISLC